MPLAVDVCIPRGLPAQPNDERTSILGGLVTYSDFRLWLKADLQLPETEVCSTPESGHFRGLG